MISLLMSWSKNDSQKTCISPLLHRRMTLKHKPIDGKFPAWWILHYGGTTRQIIVPWCYWWFVQMPKPFIFVLFILLMADALRELGWLPLWANSDSGACSAVISKPQHSLGLCRFWGWEMWTIISGSDAAEQWCDRDHGELLWWRRKSYFCFFLKKVP